MIFSCRYCRPKKRQNPSCIICIFAFLPLSFSHERERHYFSSIRHKQLSCLAQKTRWIDEFRVRQYQKPKNPNGVLPETPYGFLAIHHRIDGLSSKYGKHQLAGYGELAGGLERNRKGEIF